MADFIALGSFKNEADKRKQLERYNKTLKENVRLDEEFQEAQDESLRNQKYNITPIAPLPTTDVMLYRQRMDQIELFLQHVKNVMSDAEARRYVAIADPQVVRLINSNWSKIEKGVEGEKKRGVEVTADWLNTYIIQQFSKPESNLSKMKYNVVSSFSSGSNPISFIGSTETVSTPTNFLSSLPSQSLDEMRQSLRSYLKETYPRVWGDIDILSKSKESKIIKHYVDLDVIKETRSLRKPDIASILKYEIVKGNPSKQVSTTLPSKTTIGPLRRIVRTNGGRIFYGKGVEQNKKERYSQFGRYYIHIPSLKNSILNVKYKSLAVVDGFPRTLISESLKIFLLDLVESGKINFSLYSKLSKEDQDLFHSLARKAEVDDALELTSMNTETETKRMDEFLLLKSEVLSGNNNVDVLRQLKKYILEFMKEGRMRRNDGLELLSEIAILV